MSAVDGIKRAHRIMAGTGVPSLLVKDTLSVVSKTRFIASSSAFPFESMYCCDSVRSASKNVLTDEGSRICRTWNDPSGQPSSRIFANR